MWKSFKVSTLFGIPVYLHWSFLIVPFLIFGLGGLNNESLLTVGLFLSVFICVLLHELGHALSARRYGVETLDIILSLIGGVARLKNLPEKPIQEFIIAIAGPLVNVVIVLLILPFLYFTNGLPDLSLELTVFYDVPTFLLNLAKINAVLFLFNLVPAFPMDGGRVFRSLLSIKLGRLEATKWATYLGQLMAVCFAIYSFLVPGNFVLIIIAIFIFTGAAGEYRMAQREDFSNTHSIKDVMQTEFPILQNYNTVNDAYELFRTTGYPHFVIMNSEKIEGVVTQQGLQKALVAKQNDELVSTIMETTFVVTPPNADILQVHRLMKERQYRLIPVMEESNLVGVVDWYRLIQFLKLHGMTPRN